MTQRIRSALQGALGSVTINEDRTVGASAVLTHEDWAVLQQRVGRNLLRYQQIELRLKALLPFRKITASADGLEKLSQDIAECQKKTLGQLIPDYVDGFDFASEYHKDELKIALIRMLNDRNDLVHKLITRIGPVASVDGLEPTLKLLDDQYQYAESVAIQIRDIQHFVTSSVNAFIGGWLQSGPGPQAMFESSKQMAATMAEQFGEAFAFEIQMPFLDMLREQMQFLTAASHLDGGWVLLSRVADRIADIYAVRVSKLLTDARQVDGYEIAFRPVRAGAGSAWMYRRTIQEKC